MNVRITVSGMALTILGVFVPIIGWFILLPAGLIAMFAGLIMKEETAKVSPTEPEAILRPEEVLLDADLITSEMEAIARKMPELSRVTKTNVEFADQYATCLKDAKSKVELAGHIEKSLIQTIEKVKQQAQETESALSDLERSREVYGVKSESLETKIAQEKARLDELRANVKKWESTLHELRSKREQLANLVSRELETKPDNITSENIGLYFKVLMKYREKYGEAAEKKLKRDLTLGERRLEELYRMIEGE